MGSYRPPHKYFLLDRPKSVRESTTERILQNNDIYKNIYKLKGLIYCKYCDGSVHWEKCCWKKKSDSRQKSDGRRQNVVYGQTSKNRIRRDFSRPPKPIGSVRCTISPIDGDPALGFRCAEFTSSSMAD